ncbi:MAG: AlpA family phage regulatory protein [Rhizobium sp.]|nr:AlpA family phage regulatory protein [Rhizobium sp.]MDM8014221.1 AlpA family phage regulatory protein [Rhizobium sp.]
MTIKQVCATTSLSRTTIWRLQQRGEFPKGVKLSEARIAYRSAEIEQWISNRLSH